MEPPFLRATSSIPTVFYKVSVRPSKHVSKSIGFASRQDSGISSRMRAGTTRTARSPVPLQPQRHNEAKDERVILGPVF
jgi:hypothetical protein